ncbi:MAG: TolC family protein [Candidatus Omnitrophica bacterium]|nr:TolC family protein [Candidatus Omnitrophota bacterium]
MMLDKLKIIVCLTACILLGSSNSFAQVPDDSFGRGKGIVTLGECIRQGISSNHDLKILESKISIRRQEKWVLQSQNLPSLSLDVQSENFIDITAEYVDTNKAVLKLEQMLYDGGKTKYSVRRASKEIDIADFEYQVGRQNLIYMVKRAYAEAQRNAEKMKIARNKMGKWKQLYRNLKRRVAMGTATVIEAKRVRNHFMRMRKEYADFARSFSSWRSTIAVLTTMDARQISCLEPLVEYNIDLKTLDNYIQLAMARRQEIMESESRVASRSDSVRIAQAANLPDLRIAGEPGFISTGSDEDLKFNPTVGIRFTLFYDLYNWGRTKSMITAAQIEREISRTELDKTRLVVMSEIVDTYEQTVQSQRLLEATRTYVSVAKSAVRDAYDLFMEGRYSVRDLIDVEMECEEAELSYIDSITEMDIMKARLYRAVAYDEALIS